MTMMIFYNLKLYAIFWVINIIAILIIVRIVFFASIKKVDPIKAVEPTIFLKFLYKQKKIDDKKKLEEMS